MPEFINYSTAARVVLPAGQVPAYAYSLPELQKDAEELHGISPECTLAAACALYDRGLLSYPRVMGRYLDIKDFDEASRIVRDYQMATRSRRYDPTYQGPCWQEIESIAEKGIGLTSVAAGAMFGVGMTNEEAVIYRLVHARFLRLFRRD